MSNKEKIAVVAIILASALFVWDNRYEIVSNPKGYTYKIDKLTGRTWLLHRNTIRPVTAPPPAPPLDTSGLAPITPKNKPWEKYSQ